MKIDNKSKVDHYQLLIKQAEALLDDETDYIANAANISSLLYNQLPELNWAGFYFMRENELVLGPFQGQVACVRIPLGKGVCGTAASQKAIQRIEDVHQFEGHIACDAASNSEIVIPLIDQGKVIAVLDIDSPKLARFDETDQEYLTSIAAIYSRSSDFKHLQA